MARQVSDYVVCPRCADDPAWPTNYVALNTEGDLVCEGCAGIRIDYDPQEGLAATMSRRARLHWRCPATGTTGRGGEQSIPEALDWLPQLRNQSPDLEIWIEISDADDAAQSAG